MLDAAAEVVGVLRKDGFDGGIVGGGVRDSLLGRAPADFDIVTAARPEETAALFPDCRMVGASFGVSLVRHGGFEFEVAAARRERFYLDGRHPGEVKYTRDLGEDMLRRDFTVNALWYDPVDGVVYDAVGGIDDLEHGVLRTVGDPAERFNEDYLRMLRAVRFAARLRFSLDPATERAICALAAKCAELTGERLRVELTSMLTGPDPAGALRMLERTGILGAILPEIAAMPGVEQPPEFHPEGDVFVHTARMLEHMALPDPLLAWSVLLHDVGKPVTRSVEASGRIRFFEHETRGAEMAGRILDRFRFSTADREAIVHAVRNHMRFAAVPQMKPAKRRKLISDPNFSLELELHRLDCVGCHGMLDVFVFLLDLLDAEPELRELPEPFVRGRDLVEAGLRPGPRFRKVLDAVFDRQLAGEFATREEALKTALRLFSRKD